MKVSEVSALMVILILVLLAGIIFLKPVNKNTCSSLIHLPIEIGSVFVEQPLNAIEKRFIEKNEINIIPLYLRGETLIGPFPWNGGYAYYIDHEINLSSSSRHENDKKVFLNTFERIPYGSTVIFSPYIFNTVDENVFRKNVTKLYKSFVTKRPDLKFISAVQDGVGCSGHPTYIGWGYKDRLPFTKPYMKLINLLKIHKEICEGLGIIPQINIELFEYNPEKNDWVFADMIRISLQMMAESVGSSEKRLGPCYTFNGMGKYYDNSEFIKNYERIKD